MMRFIFVLCACVLLAGCQTISEDYKLARAQTNGKFDLGMSLAQVAEIVGRQPDLKRDTIKEEPADSGSYKTWVINGKLVLSQHSSFTFLNDRLLLWDWE